MRRLALVTTLAILACGIATPSWTQTTTEASSENRFLLTGYGFLTFDDPDHGEESFESAFVPIFLYRVSEKFLFEAEIEFEYEDEELEVDVEYAQLDWLINDRATLVLGKYLTPVGTFIEKVHPAWINKLPTFPLPYQHDSSLVPFNLTGLQLRGAVPLGAGYGRFGYSLFVANGLRIAEAHGEEQPGEDEHDEEPDEHLDEETGDDDHGGDADLLLVQGGSSNTGDLVLGGRIALAPVRGLEIGISSLEGSYDEAGDLEASITAFDIAYHHDLFDVRAEWLETETDRVADDGDLLPSQNVDAWYLQASLRLSVIPVYAFNRMELVGRFANLDWSGGEIDQLTAGLNYYFNGSTALRVAWERTEPSAAEAEDALITMFAVGF